MTAMSRPARRTLRATDWSEWRNGPACSAAAFVPARTDRGGWTVAAVFPTEGAVTVISVLVADDQEIVRTGLTMILDAQPDIEVIGEAADGREAVELARQLRPDVCLFDVRMPGMDGIEATRQLAGPDVDEPSRGGGHHYLRPR